MAACFIDWSRSTKYVQFAGSEYSNAAKRKRVQAAATGFAVEFLRVVRCGSGMGFCAYD